MTIENANSHPYRVAIVKDTEGLFANSHPYKVVIEGGGGGGYEARVVDTLPEEGEVGYIYLVLKETTSEGDIYDEYIWALQTDGTTYSWEHLGTTNEVTIKLYDTEGDNTDGAATQRLATSLKGKARVLTEADRNYPLTGTKTQVRLDYMEPGIYATNGESLYLGNTRVLGISGGKPGIAIVLQGDDYGRRFVITSNPNISGTDLARQWLVLWENQNGGNASKKEFLPTYAVVDSLTSTLSKQPLSAAQGKVLKDLVDSLAIRGAGAPTTSTVGQVGTLYEDTTNGKLYICTDATNPYVWEEVGGGGSGPTVVQTTGTSTTDVMSQNATTSMVFNNPSTKTAVKIGTSQSVNDTQTVSIGYNSQAYGMYGITIGGGIGYSQDDVVVGYNALHQYLNKPGCVLLGANTSIGNYQYSVALGYDSGRNINADGMVDVGLRSASTLGYNGGPYRLVTGLYDPQGDHDAATKGYVDSHVGASALTNTEFNAIFGTTLEEES